MRRARFTEHQIIAVLKSVEAGRTVKDVCREAGITKAEQFKKMIAALKKNNWKETIVQVRDYNWYRQTPKRVNDMISILTNGYVLIQC